MAKIKVGRRLVVKPTWRGYEPEPGQIVIEIDPGMAFGSGTHPTTRLCLALIEQRHQVDWVALAARRAEPA